MSKKATVGVNKFIKSRRVKLTGIETAVLREMAYRAEVNSLTTPCIAHEDIVESINFERHSVMRACTSLYRKGVLKYKRGRGRRARPFTIELEPTAQQVGTESTTSIDELEPKLEPTAHELEPTPQQVGTDPNSELPLNRTGNSKNSKGASRSVSKEVSEEVDPEEGLEDPF